MNKLITITSEEEYNRVMQTFEDKGWKGNNGRYPTDIPCHDTVAVEYKNRFKNVYRGIPPNISPDSEYISFQKFLDLELLS